MAGRLAEAGVGMILESNFRRDLSEPFLAPLLIGTRPVLIHCEGDTAIIARRVRERAERGERHPGHHDLAVLDQLQEEMAGGRFEPLALNVPVLRVDTTTEREYAPRYEEIVAFLGHAPILWA
ncbi:MAG: hypothetical protein IT340_15195 [Chloroflexi bacterium]|nr:hypothetical protein [Chloroflexota bacterium]